MSLSSYKLYGGDRKNNVITSTVSLYTDISDVQNQGKKFIYNGQTLYAKYGEITDSKASRIRCRINGIEKALLTSAMISHKLIDDWSNDYVHGSVRSVNKNYGEIRAFPESSKNAFINYSQSIVPLNAKNIKFTVTNVRSNSSSYSLYVTYPSGASYAKSNISQSPIGNTTLFIPSLQSNDYRGVTLEFQGGDPVWVAFDSVIIEWETEN